MRPVAAFALLASLPLLATPAPAPPRCECATGSGTAQLNCSSRAIESLQTSIDRCEGDTYTIDASHNQLRSLDCPDGWTVTHLDMSHNLIHELDTCWLNEDLRKLDVSWNALQSLDLEDALQLKELQADNNNLKELKLPLVNCSLAELNLEGNSLSRLPEGLENCTELFYLGVSNNEINELPDGVLQLMKLPKIFREREHDTLVDLRNNSLSAIDTISAVREYAKSSGHLHMYLDDQDCECAILKDQEETLRRVKICISSMCGDDINYWTVV